MDVIRRRRLRDELPALRWPRRARRLRLGAGEQPPRTAARCGRPAACGPDRVSHVERRRCVRPGRLPLPEGGGLWVVRRVHAQGP